jgi:ATP-dependent DNA ligase
MQGNMRELCQLATDWRGDVAAFGTWSERKHDGIRALSIAGELVTREGSPIHGTGHIKAALDELERIAGEPMLFDGEFVVGSFDGTLSHFGQGARARDRGTLHLFDALPLADWRRGGTDEPLHARAKRLGGLMAEYNASRAPLSWECEGQVDSKPLELVESTWIADRSDVDQAAREVWAAGGEGLMLKDAEAGYWRGRSSAWRKVKRKLRLRLPVEAVICRADVAGRAVALAVTLGGRRVRVPLQASVAERQAVYDDQLRIIGQYAIIEAMERTAKGALRQPVYKGIADPLSAE